ncbi:MAG: catalase family peroxidase [Acidobacteriia bacterium]|nr:catalase family peroxidase [Terriglobia bacterium]
MAAIRSCRVKLPQQLTYMVSGLLWLFAPWNMHSASNASPDLVQQIASIMSQGPSGKAGQRYVHAKGIVCQGTFQPSPEAAKISRAAHLRGGPWPVTVRFSDGANDVAIPDNSPDANPLGMAIRFQMDRPTDIVANSHNGFVVGTGEDFLALLKAKVATDPSKPHPWPIETFLEAHPRAMKFVEDTHSTPASFATEAFYGNNAFLFLNAAGQKQAGRYQIIPVAGVQYLDDAAAKAKPPNFLIDDLRTRLSAGPVKFRLLLQLPDPSDPTNDSSVVWPETRKTVELGVITVVSAVQNNAEAEKELAFDPTRLTDGIQLSDDPLPLLRSRVYAISAAPRRSHRQPAK